MTGPNWRRMKSLLVSYCGWRGNGFVGLMSLAFQQLCGDIEYSRLGEVPDPN